MRKAIIGILGILTVVFLYLLFSKENGIQLIPIEKIKKTDAKIDWNKDNEEAVKVLQKLLQIKTVRSNEIEAVLYLKEILEKENIPVKIIQHPDDPTKATLVAELEGSEKEGGIILANHLDVVEANGSEWKSPPFSGEIIGDRIYGRGAIDMKGMAVIELFAFIHIKRAGIPLKRKLMYLAFPDEETSSNFGAKFIVKNHREIFKGYEYAINEGGIGSKDVAVKGSKFFNLQYAEKGVLWVKAIAKGNSGHGSTPPENYASLDLIRFLEEVQEMETGVTITDETAMFFYQMGEVLPFPQSFIIKRSRNPISKAILGGVIKSNRHLKAMTMNTRSITSLQTEKAGSNVITGTAEAVMDIRLLPGVKPGDYLAKLKVLADKKNIELTTFMEEEASVSPVNSEFFQILGGVASANSEGAIVTPFMSPGATDSNYLRGIGLKCYGLIPVIVESEDIDGIHGKNENISIGNLLMGTKILFETIYNMN